MVRFPLDYMNDDYKVEILVIIIFETCMRL